MTSYGRGPLPLFKSLFNVVTDVSKVPDTVAVAPLVPPVIVSPSWNVPST